MKKYIIILAISVIVLISAIVFFFVNKSNTAIPKNPVNTIGNTAGNLYNGGYFCEKNGYVYFANSYDNNALYRMKPDETEMERLLSVQTRYINADEHYLFYYMAGSGSGEGFGYIIDSRGLNRANLDGSDAVTLDKTTVDSLLLLGNNLFYSASSSEAIAIRKMDITSRETEDILDYNIKVACGYQGNLYYNDTAKDMYLKSYNPASSKFTTLYSVDVYQPIVVGNVYYYIDVHNKYALTSYNAATGEKIILDKTRTDMFNVSSKYVYYQTSGNNPQFKRVALDGSSQEVIADGVYNSINLTSRYVYFKEYNNKIATYRIPLDGGTTVSEFMTAKLRANDY